MLGVIFMFCIESDYEWIALSAGIIFYLIMYARYRNADERHAYEKETKTKITNVNSVDNYIEQRKRLRNSRMNGANNKVVKGKK